MANELLEQQSNGTWTALRNEEYTFNNILKREPIIAPRYNREPMTTKQQIIDFLAAGNTIGYDNEWYAKIKMEIPATPAPAVEMVKCACGHTIPNPLVMSTSMGTSCSECYDEMEDGNVPYAASESNYRIED